MPAPGFPSPFLITYASLIHYNIYVLAFILDTFSYQQTHTILQCDLRSDSQIQKDFRLYPLCRGDMLQ
jgi:hypothetical protein